jgi:pilus assembly protein FimV
MFFTLRPSLSFSLLVLALFFGGLTLPDVTSAASLGDATVRSSIGQRLDADIELTLLSAAEAESAVVRIAPADAFASVGIDYSALLRSMRFSIEKQGDRYRVRVSSELAVSEPFVNLLVELSANGTRTIRQYALLIDPPAVDRPAELLTDVITAPEAAHDHPASNSSATPSTPSPGTAPNQRSVRRGETLRAIAYALQPEGLQLEQVMVALQNANPAAFIDQNVNRLRHGSVLQVPDANTMRAVDPAQARRTLSAQTADFLRYQRLLAERSAVAAPLPADPQPESPATAGNRSSSGTIGVSKNEPALNPVAVDKLTLSAPGKSETTTPVANPKDPLDKLAADKALADAHARIAALEKNIGQVQALLEIQNKHLAEAQQRAASPVASTEAQASANEAEVAPAAATAVPAAEAPAASVVDAVKPEPEAALPAGSSSAAKQSSSPDLVVDLMQDPAVRVGGAMGIALILTGWLWRRARRGRDHDSSAIAIEPTIAQTVIGESGGRQIDTSHSVFHSNFVPSVSQIDANEVDAVAEADVYIAYGRDEQAEEILTDALRTHPQRHALRVKLLEIYASRKDRQKFGTLAAELRVLTHGQGPEWTQAAQLGQVLEPGNHLYGAPSQTMTSPTAVEAVLVRDESDSPNLSPVADFELKLEGLLDERRHELGGASTVPATAATHTIEFPGATPGVAAVAASRPGASAGPEIGAAAWATKLELAIACREIGDHEGARELLVEVVNSGNPELAGQAKRLLQQLA